MSGRPFLSLMFAPVLALGLSACATTSPVTPATASATVSASPAPSSVTPSPSPSDTPTATPSDDPGADLELRGDGLGAYSFGAKQADVTQLLEDQLGDPQESSQGIGCELDDSSPWTQTVSWGSFWVQYNAKDRSKKSPRTLAAWGVEVSKPLETPLVMQDDVPLDLTFSQLKAAYPKGKTEDFGLGDGSKRFILPNKIFFVGSGNKPLRAQAGAFSLCE